jgi:hypothetical protein
VTAGQAGQPPRRAGRRHPPRPPAASTRSRPFTDSESGHCQPDSERVAATAGGPAVGHRRAGARIAPAAPGQLDDRGRPPGRRGGLPAGVRRNGIPVTGTTGHGRPADSRTGQPAGGPFGDSASESPTRSLLGYKPGLNTPGVGRLGR